MRVTSGDVTLTSDPLLTTLDPVNTDDDARCFFHVDVNLDVNHGALTGSLHFTPVAAAAAASIFCYLFAITPEKATDT